MEWSLTRRRGAAWLLAVCSVAGCRAPEPSAPSSANEPPSQPTPSEPTGPPITAIDTPAAPGSLLPRLVETDDGALLSWVEVGKTPQLMAASWSPDGWSEPSVVARSPNLLVNWADFPSVIAVDADGAPTAHWLDKRPDRAAAYSARFRAPGTPNDGVLLHEDGTATEHGFVSMVDGGDGSVDVVWLDGRRFADGGSTMQLRHRRWDGDVFGPEQLLDEDVCTCCDTDMAALPNGDDRIVVYRDRSAEEIRDIYFQVRRDGRWSEPTPVYDDGWRIAACPVNGPQVDVFAEQLGVAWFSAAAQDPRVQFSRSSTAKIEFAPPVRLDLGAPLGRVDLRWIDEARAAVIWMEKAEAGRAEVMLRVVGPDGADEAKRLGQTASRRDSGFPRMARVGSQLWVSWTDPDHPAGVRLHRIDVDRL